MATTGRVTLTECDKRELDGRVHSIRVVSGKATAHFGDKTEGLTAGEEVSTEDLPTVIWTSTGAEIAWEMTTGF